MKWKWVSLILEASEGFYEENKSIGSSQGNTTYYARYSDLCIWIIVFHHSKQADGGWGHRDHHST